MAQIEYIDLTFSDHKTWRIPAFQVASARAHYFAEGDAARGDGKYDQVYKEELEYALSDEGELLDWLGNSMDWADFADTAALVSFPEYTVDYGREFSNADKEIVWQA